MTIEKQINEDIKSAMKARDSKKLAALRAIKAAMLLEKTKGADMEIPDEVELSIIQKLVKQRKEAAELYTNQNRPDLAEEEAYQAGIIEAYLPEQMSEEDIRARVKEIIAQTGAEGMKDMGKVMGQAEKAMQGLADNKVISGIVRSELS
ncbi:MAG: glutamyl-tRNA amidotransferase [Marinilabiliales bacterium]|nr:MAG: glutamyl-tRNA amidotransferase [Marinilabiliales bacterium]